MVDQQDVRKRLSSGPAPRARNKTVVLSSDITSRVRESINRQGDGDDFVRPDQLHLNEGSTTKGIEYKPNFSPDRSHVQTRDSLSQGGLDHHDHERNSSDPGQISRPVQASLASTSSFGVNNVGGGSQLNRGVNLGPSSMQSRFAPPETNHRSSLTAAGNRGGSFHGNSGNQVSTRDVRSAIEGFGDRGQQQSPFTNLVNQPGSLSYGNYSSRVEEAAPLPSSLLVAILISFDLSPYGQSYEIREGRTIISSDLPTAGGSVLLLDDESVGSMHAVIKAESDGTLILLDQLSETGTFVRRDDQEEEERLSGDRIILQQGDIVRFGERSFKVYIL